MRRSGAFCLLFLRFDVGNPGAFAIAGADGITVMDIGDGGGR